MRFLFQFDEALAIAGRGCVLIPDAPLAFSDAMRAGARIVILSPAGERLETAVASCEFINRGIPDYRIAISLPAEVRHEMLAPGSRVYLADR